MIIASGTNFNEHIHTENEEIVLNGPPGSLKGQVFLSNKSNDILFIQDIPMRSTDRSASAAPGLFELHTSLNPGEERVHLILHRVPPQTQPGVYENTITIGGKERKLRMVVQENISIQVSPAVIYFSGVEPGKTYNKELLLHNKGNVPVTVPQIKHNTVLDFDYLCRSFSLAIRSKGGEGFTPVMDEIVKNIHKELADWAVVNLRESGSIIEPGQTMTLHFELTLPQNADPNKDYFLNTSLNTRLWNRTLTTLIKSGKPANGPMIN